MSRLSLASLFSFSSPSQLYLILLPLSLSLISGYFIPSFGALPTAVPGLYFFHNIISSLFPFCFYLQIYHESYKLVRDRVSISFHSLARAFKFAKLVNFISKLNRSISSIFSYTLNTKNFQIIIKYRRGIVNKKKKPNSNGNSII